MGFRRSVVSGFSGGGGALTSMLSGHQGLRCWSPGSIEYHATIMFVRAEDL